MAFNPFNFFRRNQKSLFAVLTVFVMIMFVLSFGKGDFFEWLPRWLGKGRGKGEVMAVVDGSKVYQSEFDDRRRSRTLANQFMSQASAVATANAYRAVEQSRGSVSEANKFVIESALQLHRLITGQDRDTQGMLGLYMQFVPQQLNNLIADEKAPKDDREVARAARDLIEFDKQNITATFGGGYFATGPNQSYKDALDFDLWLRKADQLGIGFSADDARSLVLREFDGKLSDSDFNTIAADLQKARQGLTKERLERALAEEFKVRAAQNVVIGPSPVRETRLASQTFSSPYEDYKFFRDQCVGATYGFIGVPVENYVSQVQGLPTEVELREIYNKYKNVEPRPDAETPGLKEPRKLKLGWLEVRGDEPFYKAAAADALKQAELQAKLSGFLVAPLGGADMGYLAASAPFAIPEPALQGAYDQYKQRFKTVELDTAWFPNESRFGGFGGVHRAVGPSLVKPASLAAAAGATAGSLLTFGSPFTAPLVFEQKAAAEDRNARARVAATLFANQFVPGAGIAGPVGAAIAATARLPQPLPLDVVKPDLIAKTQAELARRLATSDLQKFETELTKLGAQKDKTEAKAYLEKFAKERGLKLGGSQAFRSEYAIGEDPGLAPLKAKLERGHGFVNTPLQFGREFFFEPDPRQPRQEAMQRPRFVPATSFYNPQPYPGGLFLQEGEPTFLVWRTEEVPAEAPKSFDAGRDKAVAAWKEMKARDLAKQAAEKLAKEAEGFGNQPGTVDQKLRDLHTQFESQFPDPVAKERVKYFILDNVAPQPPVPTFGSNMAPGRTAYEPFTLRPTKDMPYPTQQMFDDLLKNKDKPISTALVMPDRGKNVYYVGVLKNRREDRIDDLFVRYYSGDTEISQLAQQVRGRRFEEERREAGDAAVALLKSEFRVEKESPKLNEKSDSSLE
jgi:hypothetical protein